MIKVSSITGLGRIVLQLKDTVYYLNSKFSKDAAYYLLSSLSFRQALDVSLLKKRQTNIEDNTGLLDTPKNWLYADDTWLYVIKAVDRQHISNIITEKKNNQTRWQPI